MPKPGRRRTFPYVAGALVLATGAPATAHHSFSMFDQTKSVTLAGSVKEFQWLNPHTWIQLMVTDPAGKAVEWSIEMNGPGVLSRAGWRASTLKPGDKVTVVIHPLRTGETGGSFASAVLPDGKTMGER